MPPTATAAAPPVIGSPSTRGLETGTSRETDRAAGTGRWTGDATVDVDGGWPARVAATSSKIGPGAPPILEDMTRPCAAAAREAGSPLAAHRGLVTGRRWRCSSRSINASSARSRGATPRIVGPSRWSLSGGARDRRRTRSAGERWPARHSPCHGFPLSHPVVQLWREYQQGSFAFSPRPRAGWRCGRCRRGHRARATLAANRLVAVVGRSPATASRHAFSRQVLSRRVLSRRAVCRDGFVVATGGCRDGRRRRRGRWRSLGLGRRISGLRRDGRCRARVCRGRRRCFAGWR